MAQRVQYGSWWRYSWQRLGGLDFPAAPSPFDTTPRCFEILADMPNLRFVQLQVAGVDNFRPFIPEGVAIIPPIQQGLQELITTDRPVAEVMAEMGAGIQAIMTDAGYPKEFPEF